MFRRERSPGTGGWREGGSSRKSVEPEPPVFLLSAAIWVCSRNGLISKTVFSASATAHHSVATGWTVGDSENGRDGARHSCCETPFPPGGDQSGCPRYAFIPANLFAPKSSA